MAGCGDIFGELNGGLATAACINGLLYCDGYGTSSLEWVSFSVP